MILFWLSSLLLTQGSEPGQMMMMMYPCNSLSSSSSPPNFAPITSLVKVQINFYWIILPRNSILRYPFTGTRWGQTRPRQVDGDDYQGRRRRTSDINNLIFCTVAAKYNNKWVASMANFDIGKCFDWIYYVFSTFDSFFLHHHRHPRRRGGGSESG